MSPNQTNRFLFHFPFTRASHVVVVVMRAVAAVARDIIATARARVASPRRRPVAPSDSSSSDVDDAFDDDFFQPALSQLPATLSTGDDDEEAKEDGKRSPPRSVVALDVEVIDLLDDDDDGDDDDDVRRMVERRDAAETSPPSSPRRDWDEMWEEATEEGTMRRMRELKRARTSSVSVDPDASDDDDETFPPPPCAPREAFQRTTAILDESFRRDGAYGAALRVAFDCTRQLGGDKEILYAYEPLTLERSVEWRYHEPTTSEAGRAFVEDARGAEREVHDGAVGRSDLFEHDRGRVRGIEKDGRDVSSESTRRAETHAVFSGGGAGETRGAQGATSVRLRESHRGMDAREVRRARGADFSAIRKRRVRGVAEHGRVRGARVRDARREIARRRNEKPISMIQFLGEKSHDYMDGSTQKKQKDDITPSDYFLRALTRISGVTAAHARGVVARYRSMDALMRAYADPTTSVEDKRRMLEDIMPLAAVSRDGTAARPGGKNRFGPAKSARVYDFFKPLARDDADRILSRYVQDS